MLFGRKHRKPISIPVKAVKEWKYSPTLLNGTPVAVVMTVTVNFHLDGNAAAQN